MELMAYAQLVSPNGRTIEIVNGARTMSHLRAGRAAAEWFDTSTSGRPWQGAEAWMFNEADYEIDPTLTDGTANPDPWWDPQDPASLQVAGFLVDPPSPTTGFSVEPAWNADRISAAGVPDLEVSLTGTVVTASRAGQNRWKEWLMRELASCCAACDGWTLRVFADIPCQDDLRPLIIDGTLANPSIDPGAPAAPAGGICDPAPPVLAPFAGVLPTVVDDGLREIPGVRFTSIDELFDQGKFPGCVGDRFRLVFTARTSTWYGRPVPTCSLGGPGSWEECDELTNPFTICTDDLAPDVPCGPVRTFARRRNIARVQQWIRPRCYLRRTCLTPPQPRSATTKLLARVVNGAGTVHNAALRVWPAIDGYPDPGTEVGANLYDAIPPVWEARIPVLRPGEVLTLDGRNSTVTLACQSGETVTGAGLVEGSGGSTWSPPGFSCDDRHWVALDLSAAEGSRGGMDLAAELSLAREEIIL